MTIDTSIRRTRPQPSWAATCSVTIPRRCSLLTELSGRIGETRHATAQRAASRSMESMPRRSPVAPCRRSGSRRRGSAPGPAPERPGVPTRERLATAPRCLSARPTQGHRGECRPASDPRGLSLAGRAAGRAATRRAPHRRAAAGRGRDSDGRHAGDHPQHRAAGIHDSVARHRRGAGARGAAAVLALSDRAQHVHRRAGCRPRDRRCRAGAGHDAAPGARLRALAACRCR